MLILAGLIIIAAILLMVKQVDVRLVLLGAGLAMAILAGTPLVIADTFTAGMVTAMVAPICASMGFAALMNATGCDRHLVHALLAPVRRFSWLVLPGGILAAYFVNVAIPSQAGTAAAIGPILIPLFLASGRPAAVAGAALVLGASFGGELLNPGAQDVQATAGVSGLLAADLSRRLIPASVLGAFVAAIVFTLLHGRRTAPEQSIAGIVPVPMDTPVFRINPVKALMPLVPITLLLTAYAGWAPLAWLLAIPEGAEWERLRGPLPVVRAMLIGALLGAAVAWREIMHVTKAFFDGMGLAYANVISLTISAQAFGAGIAAVGLADALLRAAMASNALVPLSIGFPWSLATLSGSGSGPILAFAQTFLPQIGPEAVPDRLATIAIFGGTFGRTMSPVAAVVVYSAGLVGESPLLIIRRLLPALLAGAAVAIGVALR